MDSQWNKCESRFITSKNASFMGRVRTKDGTRDAFTYIETQSVLLGTSNQ